ncbi:hypothetical protein DU478_17560 [Thalassococcus profundi]|uniref:Uncharacterized protein n=1 Tax=Thalassococcus profundi TaxID=2282382 RepID=A0A369TIA5_9RHOB|nr:hypothetical protein [Thalassococcus profundi]RDD65008.1 hypothetical protein DU478_17560 [Thalassococcus profundi]
MKKPLHPVTDHAVLRFLERVRGEDIEAVRSEIGRTVALGLEHGASAVVSGGFIYELSRSGRVITVKLANQAPQHIGSYKRRREIDDG